MSGAFVTATEGRRLKGGEKVKGLNDLLRHNGVAAFEVYWVHLSR